MDALYQTQVQQLIKGYGCALPDPVSAIFIGYGCTFLDPGYQIFIGYGCASPDPGSAVTYRLWMRITRSGLGSYLYDMDALYQTWVHQLFIEYGCALLDPGFSSYL
jgi:hypothetical protein